MNLKPFLYISSIFLLLSCKKDTTDCKTRLESQFGKAHCPNCEIRDDNSIFVDFEESDTLIFSNTGQDTLIFEHRDSLGNIDTVEYRGQGKNAKTVPGNRAGFNNDCVRWVEANYFSIEYLSNKPAHKPLFFDLLADLGSAYFTYDFMNARLTADVWAIEVGNTNGYMPVFNFKGKEFYHVSQAKITLGDGSTRNFYISRENQLVLVVASDSSYYLKIN